MRIAVARAATSNYRLLQSAAPHVTRCRWVTGQRHGQRGPWRGRRDRDVRRPHSVNNSVKSAAARAAVEIC